MGRGGRTELKGKRTHGMDNGVVIAVGEKRVIRELNDNGKNKNKTKIKGK